MSGMGGVVIRSNYTNLIHSFNTFQQASTISATTSIINTQLIPNIPTLSYQIVHNTPIYKSMVDTYAKCPITLQSIKTEEKYMTCYQCKNNFSEQPIKQWLNNKKNCPACRSA